MASPSDDAGSVGRRATRNGGKRQRLQQYRDGALTTVEQDAALETAQATLAVRGEQGEDNEPPESLGDTQIAQEDENDATSQEPASRAIDAAASSFEQREKRRSIRMHTRRGGKWQRSNVVALKSFSVVEDAALLEALVGLKYSKTYWKNMAMRVSLAMGREFRAQFCKTRYEELMTMSQHEIRSRFGDNEVLCRLLESAQGQYLARVTDPEGETQDRGELLLRPATTGDSDSSAENEDRGSTTRPRKRRRDESESTSSSFLHDAAILRAQEGLPFNGKYWMTLTTRITSDIGIEYVKKKTRARYFELMEMSEEELDARFGHYETLRAVARTAQINYLARENGIIPVEGPEDTVETTRRVSKLQRVVARGSNGATRVATTGESTQAFSVVDEFLSRQRATPSNDGGQRTNRQEINELKTVVVAMATALTSSQQERQQLASLVRAMQSSLRTVGADRVNLVKKTGQLKAMVEHLNVENTQLKKEFTKLRKKIDKQKQPSTEPSLPDMPQQGRLHESEEEVEAPPLVVQPSTTELLAPLQEAVKMNSKAIKALTKKHEQAEQAECQRQTIFLQVLQVEKLKREELTANVQKQLAKYGHREDEPSTPEQPQDSPRQLVPGGITTDDLLDRIQEEHRSYFEAFDDKLMAMESESSLQLKQVRELVLKESNDRAREMTGLVKNIQRLITKDEKTWE